LSDEHRMSVFVNMELRKIFEHKGKEVRGKW
jgi:hypothetical protein